MSIEYLASGDAAAAVLDYVGGREDLKAGVVRAIGQPMRRFTEDKLRMLRAVRFAARFGFQIERETFAAIRVLAREIGQVSRERMRDELTRMLTEGNAATAFEMLDGTGLLEQVLPEVAAMHGVEQPPQFHPEGDVWVHTLLLLKQLPAGCSATLAWGALLHDIGKPPTYTREPIAFASTGMWRWGRGWRRRSAIGCAFPMRRRSRSLRWWRTTCASATLAR